jgi:membrane-associated phospholipid phosphatase
MRAGMARPSDSPGSGAGIVVLRSSRSRAKRAASGTPAVRATSSHQASNRLQAVGALAIALTAAFAALAVLVSAGSLNGIDQWSVDHIMPGLGDGSTKPSLAAATVPLLHASWASGLDVVSNVVTLPAQALVASVIAAACCLVMRRRERPQEGPWAGERVALACGLSWLVGNGIEVLCKSTLDRPLLHANGHALVAFQSSFPSGHTLRSLLLAAIVAALWPRARRWVAAWAAAVLVLLELNGFHVPSDIAGGLLLALLLTLALSFGVSTRAGCRADS